MSEPKTTLPKNDGAAFQVRAYTGPDRDLGAINQYLEQIYSQIEEAVYQDADITPPNVIAELKYSMKLRFESGYGELIQETMDTLKDGRIFIAVMTSLMKHRLISEIGDKLQYPDLGIAFNVVLNSAAVGYLGLNQEGNLVISNLGALVFNTAQKTAAIRHEAGHIALGHLDKGYNLSNDRRQLEFDADYIGALIHRNPTDLVSFLMKVMEVERELIAELGEKPFVDAVTETHYEMRGKVPGEDAVTDAKAEQLKKGLQTHITSMSHWIYPTEHARAEEMLALDIQLKAQDGMLKAWAPEAFAASQNDIWRQRVENAIAARHINSKSRE